MRYVKKRAKVLIFSEFSGKKVSNPFIYQKIAALLRSHGQMRLGAERYMGWLKAKH